MKTTAEARTESTEGLLAYLFGIIIAASIPEEARASAANVITVLQERATDAEALR